MLTRSKRRNEKTAKNVSSVRRLPRICLVVYALTGVSLILYLLFRRNPAFSDAFNYSISAALRASLGILTTWIPLSLAELLLLLLPLWLFLLIRTASRHYVSSRHNATVYLGILLSILCTVAVLFVFTFAPGYYGRTLDEKLELPREKVSATELYDTAESLRAELVRLTPEIQFEEDGSSRMPYGREEMNRKLLHAYEKLSDKYDFIHSFPSRVKPVLLSEAMSYTHITGVYTFFTGEANLNVRFPDYTLPFTAAHELAHQRGIAREDEANFVAYLVCMESDDPYLRYSGTLSLYEYVASALYSADPTLYAQCNDLLPKEVHAEELAFSRFFDKYRENIVAEVSEATNNAYLQSQGAPEGTRSYNLVVDLAVAHYKAQKS